MTKVHTSLFKAPSYNECKRLNIPEIKVRSIAGRKAYITVDFFSCDSDLLTSAFNRIREIYEPYLLRYFQRHPGATVWASATKSDSITRFSFDVLKDEGDAFLGEITAILYDRTNYKPVAGSSL